MFYIELNLGKKPLKRAVDTSDMKLVLSTKGSTTGYIRPFEGNVYKV